MEEPGRVGVEPVEDALGVDPAPAQGEDVGQSSEPLPPFLFVPPLAKLNPLAGDLADHKAAAMQHADELLQVAVGHLLRREAGLESLLDLLKTRPAVQHLEDRILFLVEAEIIESHRFLDDPVRAAVVLLAARDQIGSHAQPHRPRRTADQTFRKGGHRDP